MLNLLTHKFAYNLEIIHLIGFMCALLLAFFFTPIIRSRAVKLGLMDQPSTRRVHTTPTPRLGGVAIFLSIAISLLILLPIYAEINPEIITSFPIFGILAGALIIFCLGLLDDIESVNAIYKLLIQFVAASIAWYMGVRIEHIVNPFFHADFVLFKLSLGDYLITFTSFQSYILSILWIIGITNAINLVDGIDGLATGVSLISAIAIWSVSMGQKLYQPVGALIAAILSGSLLGFLRWNFNPARIFLGDSGSYLTGFILASLTITCVMKSVTLAIMTPMLILIFAIPIIDTALAIFRRLLKGKSIMEPDKEHLHHKILEAGLNQKRAVYIFYLISAGLGLIASYLMSIQTFYRFLILTAIVFLLTLFFTLVLNWKRQKIFRKN